MQASSRPGAGGVRSSRLLLTVQGADGRRQSLEFTDLSEAEAVRRAAGRGLRVLSIETPLAEVAGGTSSRAPFPLVRFSQELLALLEAGMNLAEAVTTLHAKERHEAHRAVLGQLLEALREGRNLSDVLSGMPQHFSEVYVATVRASERTGDLPQALTRYVAYQVQFEALRKKLVSAAIYPAMLLGVGGFVTLFLLGYVVPRFSVVYESSGREIPWMSAMLLAFGKTLYQHWQGGLAVLATVIAAAVWTLARPQGRGWLLEQVLRMPWLAARANEFRLARFYRALSLLLAAGIPLARAMGMVQGLLGPEQQARLASCRLAVEQGQSLSVALVAAGLASEVAESLVKVGERSGQMGDMLERAARFADDEFSRWVDWASRLLEPVLMMVIGLVIGSVVVLMYMPIFDLAGSLQ
ncbi:type II secretion system F family protein [Pseudoduganella sp. R-34]|uniref:type II secretion system F family protein n=1 Tax=Pseudoduganella sp. R-34 TaxID=3404062 RepID=UPI003CF81868